MKMHTETLREDNRTGVEYKMEDGGNSDTFQKYSQINSGLFVRRDPLFLWAEEDYEIESFAEMPDFLSEEALKIDPELLDWRSSRDDLLKIKDPRLVTLKCPEGTIPGVWSGYRSCLTIDSVTGELYRLKGVAVKTVPKKLCRNDGVPYIRGGQFLLNARNEKTYSDRFNKVLREEGVEPVMEYVGLYKSHFRVSGRKIATSIIRVNGDTRLDELMYALESQAYWSIGDPSTERMRLKFKFTETLALFYRDIGNIVGQLKRLIDRSGQTWSDNPERTNAHAGNVVVYKSDDKLGVGLVDFDSSCDKNDMTRKELHRQQKEEYSFLASKLSLDGVISARAIGLYYYRRLQLPGLRSNFTRGFMEGYRRKFVKNTLEMGRIEELRDMILLLREVEHHPRLSRSKDVGADIRDPPQIDLDDFLFS